MKKLKGKNIIVELIPTHSKSEYGYVVQLSALKLNDLNLIDRFDYRVCDNLVWNKELLEMISYDKENFMYTNNTDTIMKEFSKWCEDYNLLIIDNEYTIDYLKNIPNKKESIFKYLGMEFSEDVIERIMEKYQLEPSNYIVDLLYESLIYASNDVNKTIKKVKKNKILQ